MQDENGRSIDDLKAEEQAGYIPVEEDEGPRQEAVGADISDALRDLGRQFANTIQAAWHSQERREFEEEVREGVDQFANEVRKAFREIRESGAAQRVREEAGEVKERAERADLAQKARTGLVEGLEKLSQELGKLADQFSPAEKSPQNMGDDEPI